MGIERDFLMRQLMMLFEVISRIIRFRKNGQNENASDEIDYFYKCLAVETDFVAMTTEEMMQYLTIKKNLTNEHLELIAFVLKEQGEIAKSESEKLIFFSKSWFLLDKIERESTAYSVERQLRMAELRAFLDIN
jgi:restriction endonuclease